jgi:predicted RNA-binding Zn-ribbon protein involved in translation (DUF1610 family)
MSEDNLFCLECDVLLMRLYNKPDLASVRGTSSAAAARVDEPATYTCPECGMIVARPATDEVHATHV